MYFLPYRERSKKKGKYQESIQSSTTPDQRYLWESDNFTIRHHKREPRGQPFPNINEQTRPLSMQSVAMH